QSIQAAVPPGRDYADLVALFKEFRELQPPRVTDGVPDYTPAAMDQQRQQLAAFQRRLAAIDPGGWPIPQPAHYPLVTAEMNGLEFEPRAHRPWSRDPGFYATTYLGFGPAMYGPLRIPREPGTTCCHLSPIKVPIPEKDLPEFRTKLRAVPRILDQAK